MPGTDTKYRITQICVYLRHSTSRYSSHFNQQDTSPGWKFSQCPKIQKGRCFVWCFPWLTLHSTKRYGWRFWSSGQLKTWPFLDPNCPFKNFFMGQYGLKLVLQKIAKACRRWKVWNGNLDPILHAASIATLEYRIQGDPRWLFKASFCPRDWSKGPLGPDQSIRSIPLGPVASNPPSGSTPLEAPAQLGEHLRSPWS